MNEVIELAIRLLPAVATIATVLAGLTQSAGKVRSTLKIDAETLSLLPEGEAKRKLEAYVAERVEHLKKIDSGTRDWAVFPLAVVGTVLLGYATIWLSGLGHWWAYGLAVAAGCLGLVFLYGVFETVQKKDRTGEKKPKR